MFVSIRPAEAFTHTLSQACSNTVWRTVIEISQATLAHEQITTKSAVKRVKVTESHLFIVF